MPTFALHTLTRTTFLTAVFAGLTVPALAVPKKPAGTSAVIYRDTGCGCCEGWAAAMSAAGYRNTVEDIEHAARLKRFAIAEELSGCHTAVVDGYLIEGHVPIAAVTKLLAERPATRGITLPGMPMGTPGMPGHPTSRYNVVFLDDPKHIFFTQ